VVVGLRPAELVDALGHEFGGLEGGCAVERDDLVERAVRCAFGACTVVPDDQEDQGVLEHIEFLEGVEKPPDLVVGVFHEARIDLHLPGQHGLEVLRDILPRRDLGRTG
jgi:hypothetical protein